MKRKSFSARLLYTSLVGLVWLATINDVSAHSKGEWQSTRKIYNSTCHYCHDTGVGPTLMGRNLPASYIEARVRAGFNAMPAFKPSEIGESDLKKLAQWIADSPASKN